MIEINNIYKNFGDKVIFDNYSVTIDNGEFVVIKGKSGAGKTTLLHMIGRIEKPDSGEIKLNGKNIFKEYSQKEYFGEKVSFLFQNFALVEGEKVSKNLSLIPKKNRTGITMEKALEKVGLNGFEDKVVYQLSGGEQQRVALARILMKKSDVILADEPTGSLDIDNANEVVEILKHMNNEGKTIVVVTHSNIFDSVAAKTILI